MDDARAIDAIRDKFRMLSPAIDERVRRLWAATEAMSCGWGGVTVVATATGMAHTTIRRGMRELEPMAESDSGPQGVRI